MRVYNGRLCRAVAVGIFAGAITTIPVTAIAAVATDAVADPRGTLKLASRTLVPGGTVQIDGERFARGKTLELVLIGLDGRIRLGDVIADSVGRFARLFDTPADLDAGPYRLVAIAADGDEVASLNVELMAAPEEPEAGDAHPEAAEPTGEPLALDRAESPWVTGGALVGIVFALVAGGLLLRKPRGTV